jgi:hypothetical protein
MQNLNNMNKDNNNTELNNTDKKLHIYAVMCSFFDVYLEETTMRISDNEVIELGGFILTIFMFLGGLFLLNHIGVISVF